MADAPAAATLDARAAAWERVKHARDVKRPHALELLELMASDVVELHGDRFFRDDPAIVAGFASLDGRPIVFVGQQKGAETEENIRRNFGMPHPEGYRKAMRLFVLAERLGLPVVTFVDTPGAFPGPASEERGVAESIARSIAMLTRLRVPIVVVITGEGGSGGALALAAGDVVIALENAIYSVISPEGCASILWRSADAAPEAAVAMRLTATEQVSLGVVDEVVPEPPGGARDDPSETATRLKSAIVAHLDRLAGLELDALLDARYARYRAMGAFATVVPTPSVRPERQGLGERIRTLLEIGRITLGGPEPIHMRPQAADEADEPPLREEV